MSKLRKKDLKKKSLKKRMSLKERIESIDIDKVTFRVLSGIMRYGFAGLAGAFIMYCAIHEDFKLSSSTAFSLKGKDTNVVITRQDIKEYLDESDRQAILNMTDLVIREEFYKDIDISSKEEQKKLKKYYDSYIAETYGNKSTFNTYKKVYKISSDYINRCMAINVKQEKKLAEIEAELEIDSSSIDTEWKTNKESYQYVTCDAVVFSNEESAEEFYSKALVGDVDYDSLNLATAQVGYDEKIYFNDSRLKYSLSKKYESDVISTYTADGYPIVMIVSDRKATKKQLKKDIESNLRNATAKDKLNARLESFENSLEISVESEKVNTEELNSEN